MRLAGRRGYTLVELMVSVMLIALIAGPMLSTGLTARESSGHVDRRTQAAGYVRALSEQLKEYVTADRSLAAGPGAGDMGWSLPGDRSKLPALGAGHHDLDVAVWAPALVPYQGSLSYDVAVRMTTLGPEPDVTFSIGWSEP